MIQGFWHVSFTVRELESSVKWYTEARGLEYVRGAGAGERIDQPPPRNQQT